MRLLPVRTTLAHRVCLPATRAPSLPLLAVASIHLVVDDRNPVNRLQILENLSQVGDYQVVALGLSWGLGGWSTVVDLEFLEIVLH